MIRIFCDGGSRGNPGQAASAFVVYKNGKEFYKEGKFLGIATNNFAEYQAVILAMQWIEKNEKDEEVIEFLLDSQLVVNQLNGVYKIKEKTLIDFAMIIRNLKSALENKITFTYIPREENKMADHLVNETLDNFNN